MIDRQHGDLVFECDICNNVLETNQADFASAWSLAKRDGWKSWKIGNDWIHNCGCQTKAKP